MLEALEAEDMEKVEELEKEIEEYADGLSDEDKEEFTKAYLEVCFSKGLEMSL